MIARTLPLPGPDRPARAEAEGPGHDRQAPAPLVVDVETAGSAPRLRTIAEAARFLGLSPRKVWTMARTPADEPGSIPHVVLPIGGRRRHVRFDLEDLRSWARAGCPAVCDWQGMRKSGERA